MRCCPPINSASLIVGEGKEGKALTNQWAVPAVKSLLGLHKEEREPDLLLKGENIQLELELGGKEGAPWLVCWPCLDSIPPAGITFHSARGGGSSLLQGLMTWLGCLALRTHGLPS